MYVNRVNSNNEEQYAGLMHYHW